MHFCPNCNDPDQSASYEVILVAMGGVYLCDLQEKQLCYQWIKSISLLTEEQRTAMAAVGGKDVFTLLPTVFGRSLIYQLTLLVALYYCVSSSS